MACISLSLSRPGRRSLWNQTGWNKQTDGASRTHTSHISNHNTDSAHTHARWAACKTNGARPPGARRGAWSLVERNEAQKLEWTLCLCFCRKRRRSAHKESFGRAKRQLWEKKRVHTILRRVNIDTPSHAQTKQRVWKSNCRAMVWGFSCLRRPVKRLFVSSASLQVGLLWLVNKANSESMVPRVEFSSMQICGWEIFQHKNHSNKRAGQPTYKLRAAKKNRLSRFLPLEYICQRGGLLEDHLCSCILYYWHY